MEKKKLFKVILGGVVSSFVFSGCQVEEQENNKSQMEQILAETFSEQEKAERNKLIQSLDTAKKVEIEAYNGESLETLVDKDSIDLLLLIAYYDALETKLCGNPVKNYMGEGETESYYKLNYQAIMNAFNKKAGSNPTKEKLIEVYDELLNEWNLWNLSYCAEEVQQSIGSKMVEIQNKKYQNYSFEYIDHLVKYEDCEYQDTKVKVPVYYFSMQSYKKGPEGLVKDQVISVLPDPLLIREIKKSYYEQHEKSMINLGVYRRTGSSSNERYILLKQYYDVVPGTNYQYLFFVLQCQSLKDGQWENYGQITINQDLFKSFERVDEISFPSISNKNGESSFQVNGATAYVNTSDEEVEILGEEPTSYHR